MTITRSHISAQIRTGITKSKNLKKKPKAKRKTKNAKP